MSSFRIVITLILTVLAGCAMKAPSPPEADTRSEAVIEPIEAAYSPATPVIERQQSSNLTAEELAIFNDPDYKRQFIMSYRARTDDEPQLTIDEQEIMFQVLDLLGKNKLDEAAVLVQSELERPDASAAFDFTMAHIHNQREEFSLAGSAYEVATRKFDNYLRAWKYLGHLRYRGSDFAGAAQALTRMIHLGGADEASYGMLAICYSNTEDYIAAESAFRMAAMLAPHKPEWQMGMADTFFRQGRFGEAAALLETLIKKEPDRAELWLAQGEAFARMGRTDKAIENLEMVDMLGGSNAASLNNLGDIYSTKQVYGLAVRCYLRALEVDGGETADRALRAMQFLAQNGVLDQAARLADGIESARGTQLTETDKTKMLHLRARIAADSGASAEQAEILRQIVELDPTDGEAMIQLGTYAAQQEDYVEAFMQYERAANIAKVEAKAKLLHGELLAKQKRYSEALPLIKRAFQLEPRSYIERFLKQVEILSGGR